MFLTGTVNLLAVAKHLLGIETPKPVSDKIRNKPKES